MIKTGRKPFDKNKNIKARGEQRRTEKRNNVRMRKNAKDKNVQRERENKRKRD